MEIWCHTGCSCDIDALGTLPTVVPFRIISQHLTYINAHCTRLISDTYILNTNKYRSQDNVWDIDHKTKLGKQNISVCQKVRNTEHTVEKSPRTSSNQFQINNFCPLPYNSRTRKIWISLFPYCLGLSLSKTKHTSHIVYGQAGFCSTWTK